MKSLRETREMPVETRPARPRRRLRRPRRADRRALRHARAARREIARADRRAAALGARDRAGDLGQRRGHAGLPDAQRGARARRPADRARRGRRGARKTASCTSSPRMDESRSSSSRCWCPSRCSRRRRARSTCRTRSCSSSAARCSASCPGCRTSQLNPDLVLVIFLPPLLYAGAFFANLRDLRRDLRPISLLSIGLVLATMPWSPWVAHELIDGLSWPAAFALGAIVGPTDPVAATAIARRLGVPRRIVSCSRAKRSSTTRRRSWPTRSRVGRGGIGASRCWTPAGTSRKAAGGVADRAGRRLRHRRGPHAGSTTR